jgi:AcrR family transcriptional regulator
MRASALRARKPKQFAGCKGRPRGSGGRTGRPRSEAADKAILKAALKLFIRRGFDGVTLEEIAATARVARTTVYRRWSSKEDLIAQAIAMERGAPERDVAAESAPSGALRDHLIDTVAATLTAPSYRNMVARLIGSVPDHPELMSVYWRTYLVPRRAPIAAVLERAQIEGLIRDDIDPEIVLDLIGGVVMHELLVRPGKRSAQTLRGYLHRVMHALDLDGQHAHEKALNVG